MRLVTFDQDWADEFRVYGLALMDATDYEAMLKWAKNADWSFGTNEGWEGDDIRGGFSYQEVTDDEVKVLRHTIFGKSDSTGIFPDWKDMLYDQIYSRYEIRQDGGGYEIAFEDTGLMVAFGYGSYDEANDALHRIAENEMDAKISS